MATNFPGSVDSFPRPTSSTTMDASGYEGDVVIDNLSDALEAVETELGTNPSGSFATVKARLDAMDAWPDARPMFTGAAMQVTGNMSGDLLVDSQLCAVWMPKAITPATLSINVKTAQASATGVLAIYTQAANGTLTRLDYSSSIDLSSTGEKQLTRTWATIPAGVVWMGVLRTSTATNVYLHGGYPGLATFVAIRDTSNAGRVDVGTVGSGYTPPTSITVSSALQLYGGAPPYILAYGGS
jgi:hypothetical protein